MTWQTYLTAEEEVRWQGRPAPRCYTFRHWRHSIFGALFLAVSIYWQVLGVLMAETYAIPWLAWLPVCFVLTGGYLSVGHLLQARLEWNHVHYVITDRRILCQRGLLWRDIRSMELAEITYFKLQRQGDQLGTFQIHKGEAKALILHCIEYPQRVTELLESAMQQEERLVAARGTE